MSNSEMPVEPECVTRMRRLKDDPTWDVEWATLRYIDALKAYALKEKERADEMTQRYQDKFHEAITLFNNLMKAESELAALRGRLMEPDDCHCPKDKCMAPVVMGKQARCIRKAMSAVILKEGK